MQDNGGKPNAKKTKTTWWEPAEKKPSGLRGKGMLHGYSRVNEGHCYGVAIVETWNNVILVH